MSIDFAGGPYTFRGLSKAQEEGIYNHFKEIACEKKNADQSAVISHVYQKPPDTFLEFDRTDQEYTLDIDAQAPYVRVAGLRIMAHIDLKPQLTGAFWTSEQDFNVFPSLIFENYLRIIVAYRLLVLGGALLHSAGIADEQYAYLILGHSGAGKSTFSRNSLNAGYTVLSDDLNAFLWNLESPVLERVPFSGDLGRTNSRSDMYPLKKIYCLKKCSDIFIHPPLGLTEAIAMLISCAPYVNIDQYRINKLIDNFSTFAQTVPMHKLSFPINGNVSNVIG